MSSAGGARSRRCAGRQAVEHGRALRLPKCTCIACLHLRQRACPASFWPLPSPFEPSLYSGGLCVDVEEGSARQHRLAQTDTPISRQLLRLCRVQGDEETMLKMMEGGGDVLSRTGAPLGSAPGGQPCSCCACQQPIACENSLSKIFCARPP